MILYKVMLFRLYSCFLCFDMQRDQLDEDCITTMSVHEGVSKSEMRRIVSQVSWQPQCRDRKNEPLIQFIFFTICICALWTWNCVGWELHSKTKHIKNTMYLSAYDHIKSPPVVRCSTCIYLYTKKSVLIAVRCGPICWHTYLIQSVPVQTININRYII